ncbi:MAG: hypothetical protein K2P61_02160 [Burkholderiaceae bacterium]|nr:hypothetical protein [Burkholderiaceae bacterium]
MAELSRFKVVRFPIPAKGDLAAHITRLEDYEKMVAGWDRQDIPAPTFDQWLYIIRRSERLPDNNKDQTRGEIQFAGIEALVLQLNKCNLALVRKHTADSPPNTKPRYESLKLSLELLQQLNLEQRYLKRLNELFDYFLIDCASVIDWEQVGLVPHAQSGMRQVLDKILNQIVVGYAEQRVQKERAIGMAEGATALMIQTGACQPEEANQLLAMIKEKLRTPTQPLWNSIFGIKKKR